MIVLDTNVLLRYAHPNDPSHTAVHATVTQFLAASEELAIVPQNLYEFWVSATRPVVANGLGLTTPECREVLAGLKAAFTSSPIT